MADLAPHRLDDIVEVLVALARLEFDRRVVVTGPDDPLAGIATGINMLAEELAATVASKHELQGALRALEASQAQLVHAGKLASIGQLAGGVAHEINNPTAAAILANDLAVSNLEVARHHLDGVAPDHPALALARAALDDARRKLDDGNDALERIRSVVHDLRIFSRVDVPGCEAVVVDDVVRAACNLSAPEVRQRARLDLDLAASQAIAGNRGRIGQVITNLLINAVQALPTGRPDQHHIRIATHQEPGRVVVVVEDSGPGVPEAIRPRIFEPFFTTKGPDEGTGLGLSLVAEIVRDHGGTIALADRPGGGARFVVTLDAKPAESTVTPPPSPADARSVTQGAAQGLRILIVDDDDLVRRSLAASLSPPHDVVAAASGQQALDILTHDVAFDLILCDVIMAGVDGPTFWTTIRERHPHLARRFLFCTGGTADPEVQAFIDDTGVAVLHKPFSRTGLLAAIATAMGRLGQAGGRAGLPP